MKKQVQLALAGAAVGMMSLMAVPQGATAQDANFARVARGLNTWMARAMDQCSSATTSVTGTPPSGCIQANGGTTDDTLGMRFMKLRVTNRGRIALFGTGFTLGDVLRVRLTLRVTKGQLQTKHPPDQGVPQSVTFNDVTVDCPKPPDAFNARPNGAVIGSTDLGACLSPNSGLAQGNVNIEILDASLINVINGKTVAVPGIVR